MDARNMRFAHNNSGSNSDEMKFVKNSLSFSLSVCVCVFFAIYVKEVSTEKNCHLYSDDCLWRMCDVLMQWIHYSFFLCCWLMICVLFDIVQNVCVPSVSHVVLSILYRCVCVPKSSYLYAFDCTLSFAYINAHEQIHDIPWKYRDRTAKRMLWQVVL